MVSQLFLLNFKKVDLTLAGITITFAFIDDILIVTHGTEDEHTKKVKEVLKRLDGANISLELDNALLPRKTLNGSDINCQYKGWRQSIIQYKESPKY